MSGVRLGKPGPVTRSRSIGGFFSQVVDGAHRAADDLHRKICARRGKCFDFSQREGGIVGAASENLTEFDGFDGFDGGPGGPPEFDGI